MNRVDDSFLKIGDVTIPIAQLQDSVVMNIREIGFLSQNAQADVYYDQVVNHLVMRLRYRMAQSHVDRTESSSPLETRSYPSTWWQHFKERWFPKWLKDRFPVRYVVFSVSTKHETVNHYHCCPHLPVEPTHTHVSFLTHIGNREDLYRAK